MNPKYYPYFIILLFTLLFLQFPLTNSYPGNCDTYLGLAKLNYYSELISSLFNSSPTPTSDLMDIKYGESVYLLGSPYILLKLIGFNDNVSFYFLMVFLFSFTSISLYKLSSLYIDNKGLCFASSLFFGLSNFTFGHIDDLNIVFYGLLFLSLYNLKRFFETKKLNYFLFLLITSLAQIHSSIYNYFSLLLVLAIFLIVNIRLIFKNLNFYGPRLFLFLLINSLFLYQFLLPRMELKKDSDFVNPWNNKAIANIHSFFSIKDFLRKIPGNIYSPKGDINSASEEFEIYGNILKGGYSEYLNPLKINDPSVIKMPADNTVFYHQLRRSAFLGYFTLVILLLGLIGIKRLKGKYEIVFFLSIGTLFSIGPTFNIGEIPYKTPLFYFYKTFEWISYYRVPTRVFFVALFALSVLYANGIRVLLERIKVPEQYQRATIFGLCLIFMIENIPFPFRKSQLPAYPAHIFQSHEKSKILHIPSQIGYMFFDDSGDYFPYSREFIYMNWSSKHKRPIANGVNSYFSSKRFELQNKIKEIDLKALKQQFGITHIAIHKHLILNKEDEVQVESFLRKKDLSTIFNSSQNLLLKIN